MKINLNTPIFNRAGVQMVEGTAENPGKEATIGSLLLQVLDTPISDDAKGNLEERLASARVARAVYAAKDEVELNSGEISLLLNRAAAQILPSVVFEQMVDSLDPARWRM